MVIRLSQSNLLAWYEDILPLSYHSIALHLSLETLTAVVLTKSRLRGRSIPCKPKTSNRVSILRRLGRWAWVPFVKNFHVWDYFHYKLDICNTIMLKHLPGILLFRSLSLWACMLPVRYNLEGVMRMVTVGNSPHLIKTRKNNSERE